MSFIKKHLIKKIKDEVNRKQDSINFNGFFYFDNIIEDDLKKWKINRVNRENAFPYERAYFISLNSIGGPALIKMYDNLKNNEFYFYKKVNQKEHKIRLKRDGIKR